MKQYAANTVRNQTLAVLQAWGLSGPNVQIIADVMLDTDLAGIDSHGIAMLPGYQRLISDGHLNINPRPTTAVDSNVTATMDADNGLGHAVAVEAMKLASTKASQHGIGAVAVRRSHHFGAAGYHAKLAAKAGHIGLVTSTTRTKAVVPTRAASPLLGTNPLAFSAPTNNPERPFLLDMSTSTVAVNKVKIHDYEKSPLPDGWVQDADGKPVTDSAAAYSQLRTQQDGGLTPLGGSELLASHKGYGLAVVVQILAGALSGASFAPVKETSADDIGHFCLAINPGFFGTHEDFTESVTQITNILRNQSPINSERPVLVPGDRERQTRAERIRAGIPLSHTLIEQLHGICTSTGATFHL
ncbi:Ldh family oxidoreductase [Arthrobacter pigmenti]